MKYIKYTEEAIEAEALAAYEAVKAKLQQDAVACHGAGKGTAAEVRPAVYFEDEAWDKAKALVNLCDKEIAWHGTVVRDGLNFTIEDVFVPPQEVTGTTVDSDETQWAMWSMEFSDDEFSRLRCHMHSHVNMGVFSSATDDDYQKDMVTKNPGLDYYIFLIFNKKGQVFARIYDVENNIMYGNEDIDVMAPENIAETWAIEQIKEQVKEKTYKQKTTPHRGTWSYTHEEYPLQQYLGTPISSYLGTK